MCDDFSKKYLPTNSIWPKCSWFFKLMCLWIVNLLQVLRASGRVKRRHEEPCVSNWDDKFFLTYTEKNWSEHIKWKKIWLWMLRARSVPIARQSCLWCQITPKKGTFKQAYFPQQSCLHPKVITRGISPQDFQEVYHVFNWRLGFQ